MFVHPELGYFDEREDLTAARLYAGTQLAFGRARALPPIAYRSKVFADLEDEKIWTRDWIFVGGLDQIPEAGDLLPYTVGHHGLHVQRRANTSLIGRFNKAQHGGCRAVPLQCQTGVKTKCSFTSCGYSRDRDVIPAIELGDETPAMRQYLGEQPDRLSPVRVDALGPFVHVNLDQGADDLESQLCPVGDLLAPYAEANAKGIAGFWVEHKCNWKLAGKAFLDHAEAPGMAPVKTGPRGKAKPSGTVAAQARRTIPLRPLTDHDLPIFATLDDAARGEARLAWAFPNLLIVAMPDHLVTIGLQPTAFCATLYRVRLYVSGKAKGIKATHPAVVKRLGFWRDVLAKVGEHAAAAQIEAERWGTPSWPETQGKKRPIEQSEYGYILQRYVVDRLLTKHDYHWAGAMTDARVR